jgi:flavin-dependent dehydrogenase
MKNNGVTYDVVIIGAGVAGCACALFIKKYAPQCSVLMVERLANTQDSQSLRVGETIPPHTAQLLQHLDLWQSFLSHSFLKSFGTAAAWGEDALYCNEYIYSANGYGWHLDRTVFDAMMVEACVDRGINIVYDHSLVRSIKTNEEWELDFGNESATRKIFTSFVIDATGKHASFAKMQGANKKKDDALIGIYQHFNGFNNNNLSSGTIVETCPYGWWYSACIPGGKAVVSFMTDGDIAHKLNLTGESNFLDFIQTSNHTKARIESSDALSKPKAISAQTHLLDVMTGEGWLAVGDAASAYDPISSMGIFKSLAMSQYAAYAVIDYIKGNKTGLDKYQKIVHADFNAYQIKRKEYYTQEQRFATSLFWKRRQHQNIIHQ